MRRPLHNLHDDETLSRESSPAQYQFTVGYDNTGLWCGVAFFSYRQHALRGGALFCVPELHIRLKSGGELVLHQLDDAWRFRDLIQAGPDALFS